MKSKTFKLLLTQGDDEEVLAILVRECFPNHEGDIHLPQTIRHEGDDFILKRKWFIQDTYIYGLSQVKKINELLFPTVD